MKVCRRNKKTVRDMELDILSTVEEYGTIAEFIDEGPTSASKALVAKYESFALKNELTAVFNYLLEERYLYPYINQQTGKESMDSAARGLTPKGVTRLEQLRHPVRVWLKKNWFAVVIAFTTLAATIASIVMETI